MGLKKRFESFETLKQLLGRLPIHRNPDLFQTMGNSLLKHRSMSHSITDILGRRKSGHFLKPFSDKAEKK